MRNLHLLPLPPLNDGIQYKVKDMSLTTIPNDLAYASEKASANCSVDAITKDFSIPPEWELIIASLNRRKHNLKDRLSQW